MWARIKLRAMVGAEVRMKVSEGRNVENSYVTQSGVFFRVVSISDDHVLGSGHKTISMTTYELASSL